MVTVYFITGCNRGLGLEFVKQISERPEVFIYATVRDQSKATELNKLAADKGNIQVVTLVGEADAQEAAALVGAESGKIDVILCNAGISNSYAAAAETSFECYREHWEVNFLNVVMVYQALYGLLIRSSNPKFVAVSSGAGSTARAARSNSRNSGYGCSKAALNHLIARIYAEEEANGVIALALNPGLVATDMGLLAIEKMKFSKEHVQKVTINITDSVRGQLKIIDNATRENTPKLYQHDGSVIEW